MISYSAITKASLSKEKLILNLGQKSLFIFILSGVKYQSFIFTAPKTSIFHKES